MLNLAFLFDDAIHAVTQHAKDLTVVPLPAAVYMMQVDVINHYDHALAHYLTVTLDEPFLQDSSLGTPYQKWAYFTNRDFETLSFTIHNLLRYTSRLIHETDCLVPTSSGPHGQLHIECAQRLLQSGEDLWEERAIKSNSYTEPMTEIRFRNKSIGVVIHDDHRLSIAALRTRPSTEDATTQLTEGEPARDSRVPSVDVTEHEQPLEDDEHEEDEHERRTASAANGDDSGGDDRHPGSLTPDDAAGARVGGDRPAQKS